MHPEIHATKPGNCPKCGMKLVKEKPKAVKKPVSEETEYSNDSKDTSRPKPVNKDVKDTMQMSSINQQKPVTYTCPMHPEIHSNKPGNCPKCGMKLVKEKAKNAS